jgi:tetratricopeptide (TPR) repeat protein
MIDHDQASGSGKACDAGRPGARALDESAERVASDDLGEQPAGDVAAWTIARARLDEAPQLPQPPQLPHLDSAVRLAALAEPPHDGQHADHPTAEVLWGFMAGGLEPGEMRRVLGHLLGGCPRCQEAAREVWNLEVSASQPAVGAPSATAGGADRALDVPKPLQLSAEPSPASPAALESAYDAVLDRVFSRVSLEEAALESARRRGRALFDELMQHPAARQLLLVQNSSRFRDRQLCENLLSASHESGFHDPALSQQLARLAVEIAERVPQNPTAPAAGLPRPEILAGLRARAWAQLGNAFRINSDFASSAGAFERAEAVVAANPEISPLDKARVLDLRASLCRVSRQMVEAERLLDRVIAIYRRLGQSSLLGQAFNQKAIVLTDAGQHQASMEMLRRALDLLDPHGDPRWFLIVRHNLICALVRDGRPREAFALLFHTRPLYLKMGDRMHLLRLRCLEGTVAQALGRLDQAEAAYREARDAFVEMGIAYEAALVSLDLAGIFAQQGRSGEVRCLALEMMAFFESHQLHVHAMAAMMFFFDAARMERAGQDLVNQVSTFLRQARNAPDMEFSPG